MVVITNEGYWDCECEYDYIHPKTQKTCPDCGSNSYDQPDSRENELKYLFKPKNT
jgi:hypothetical protein